MSDEDWMRRCLALAARAAGRTAPNPMVGAVLVRDGALIGEGWHRAPGQAHGEVDALARSSGPTRGATLYVNLEPCCHWGRTPPCTDAILSAEISRVVVGMVDPDSRMSGKGIAQLRAAGVTVDVGVLEDACRALNAAYLSAQTLGRPRVTLKAAATLDGRIAAHDGQSRWITGEAARAAGHGMRDRHDAVLVGSGTLLADDPALNTRLEGGRDALPVILDSRLRCPPDAAVLRAGRRPRIYTAPDAPAAELPADVVAVQRGPDGRLDLRAVLADLLAVGVHSVLVEGGAAVHRAFFDAGLVDQVELFLAPSVLVGGPGWVGGPPLDLAERYRLEIRATRARGADLQITLTSEGALCSAES